LASIQNDLAVNATTYAHGPLLTLAASHFDSAIAYASTLDSLRYLGEVGLARALLDNGNADAAASAIADVPSTFTLATIADGTTTFNHVAEDIRFNLTSSVSDREGINGLPFLSEQDPRVPVDSVGTGVGGPIYGPSIYPSVTSPTVWASGVEATLIRAEVALHDGQLTAWADSLNALRAAFPDTALSNHPLPADSTTAAGTVQQTLTMFHERAEWLFGTAHRQGDMRRMVTQYGLPTESVFPTGTYQGGPSRYGTDVTYTPVGDQTVVGYSGCINRLP
jgi:hypothetical protein